MINIRLNNDKLSLFFYLLCLTGVFALLEINFFLQSSGFYFADYHEVASQVNMPWAIVPGIVFFIFAQICVHIAFTAMILTLGLSAATCLRLSWHRTEIFTFALWCLGLIFVLFANEQYFPNSKFGNLVRTFFPHHIVYVLFVVFASFFLLITVLALIGLVQHLHKNKKLAALACLTVTILILLCHPPQLLAGDPAPSTKASNQTQPNIIIIGVDSLRPDFLGYNGAPTTTPNIDKFLTQAVVFPEALTPIARTFPAWISILTGQYPKLNGIRYDLANTKNFDFTQTLSNILRGQGYKTIYAIDETRFSNIDEKFGFDQVISPPMGVNDFLLGTFNDFPFSNFIVNTWVGKWLFPYSYGNRPALFSYNPDSFINLLKPALIHRDKPLFFAVHFCLPHYPYFWQQGSYLETDKAIAHYRAALNRVDKQVGDLLTMLNQYGILQHSIVILLSDHGEGLELHGDRITFRDRYISGKNNSKHIIPKFYPPSLDFEGMNQSAGHGTDVLGLVQYHIVLAFRFQGMGNIQPHEVSGIASLIDIKPTVLSLLHIPYQNVSGITLQPGILNQEQLTTHQHFFLESDFAPASIRSVHPEMRHVVLEGINFFEIDPVTTRIIVKPEMGKLIVSSKQYADVYDGWILALYPQAGRVMQPVLVNLQTGMWTTDLNTTFARLSPAKRMLTELKKFYKDEIL